MKRKRVTKSNRKTIIRSFITGFVFFSYLFFACQAGALSFSSMYGPDIEHWFSGPTDTKAGQILVPIQTDTTDSGFFFLNAVADLNKDTMFGTYDSQTEWISQNVPIPIEPSTENYYANYFALVDPGVTGTISTRILVSQNPIDPSLYPSTGWNGTLPYDPGSYIIDDFLSDMVSFDRGVGDPLGPTGGGIWPFLPVIGDEHKLPKYITQPSGSKECYISSVAMSLYWLKEKYPSVFKNLPNNQADLLKKMKESEWWKNYGLIPWGDLAKFKKWILDQYNIKGVIVEEWSAPKDPYDWIVEQYKKGQDIELSVKYKRIGGHSMTVVGWLIWDGFKWVKVIDPLQATRNNLPVEKLVWINGLATNYGGGSTVRAIDAESVPESSTILLLGSGLVLTIGLRRKKMALPVKNVY